MARVMSAKGREVLKQEEGEVLKAYRCPAGKLTIGVGLTAASGVIDPKPGMVITREQSDALLTRALARNYEPAVRKAMPGASQFGFDGGVSFHFNTGAIGRASWVKAWRVKPIDWQKVHAGLTAWRKGGGKVLPGLVRRRDREYRIMRFGDYSLSGAPAVMHQNLAKWALPVNADEVSRIRAAFAKLGYAPGKDVSGVYVQAVMQFQADHDLTVDGILGRATLSTLQRRLDAAAKTTRTVAGGTAAGGGAEAARTGDIAVPDWALWVIAGVIAFILLRLAWSYRDVIAAKVQRRMPTLARFLRSF